MDDQFGGRTDDDLFADDFEPVTEAQTEPVAATPPKDPSPVTASPPPKVETPVASGIASSQSPRKGLAHSKYNDNPPPPPQPVQPAQQPAQPPPPEKTETTTPPATGPPAQASGTSTPRDGKNNSSAPFVPGSNTALKSEIRVKSGANPRQKLTDEELTARMEQMKLKNAERTRKFERAEADQRTHDASVARGIEEARKKRIADEEKKRRGEEDRKKMEDERAKNRERKLRAMEHKDGAWDQGKLEEQDDVRDFRGAHGGIRGSRGVDSLGGSRYAREDYDDEGDAFKGRGRGRGRGRGGPGRSRGGRGGAPNRGDAPQGNNGPGTAAASSKPAVLSTDDFPALPGADKFSPITPLGNTTWGDEMDALDAKMAKK